MKNLKSNLFLRLFLFLIGVAIFFSFNIKKIENPSSEAGIQNLFLYSYYKKSPQKFNFFVGPFCACLNGTSNLGNPNCANLFGASVTTNTYSTPAGQPFHGGENVERYSFAISNSLNCSSGNGTLKPGFEYYIYPAYNVPPNALVNCPAINCLYGLKIKINSISSTGQLAFDFNSFDFNNYYLTGNPRIKFLGCTDPNANFTYSFFKINPASPMISLPQNFYSCVSDNSNCQN